MRSFFGVATRRTGCAKHNGVKFILLRFVGLFEKKKKKKRPRLQEQHWARCILQNQLTFFAGSFTSFTLMGRSRKGAM